MICRNEEWVRKTRTIIHIRVSGEYEPCPAISEQIRQRCVLHKIDFEANTGCRLVVVCVCVCMSNLVVAGGTVKMTAVVF